MTNKQCYFICIFDGKGKFVSFVNLDSNGNPYEW